MVWIHNGVELKSPSAYKISIEDTDKDSYSSPITGALIDNPIAVGLLNVSMSWELATEQEAEEIVQKTYKNPFIATIKAPVINGGILENAPFRISKRSVEMVQNRTGQTYWTLSFNMMQKELTQSQKNAVINANS